jgi:TetR/AcrR family transcriptional regulator, mexJK operon transcriptional repressor
LKKTSPKKRAGRMASAAVITEAATRLFMGKGYAGTSMDEIAADAGVSKQTIYSHFAGKEDLFTGLVAGTTERAKEFIESIPHALQDSTNARKDLRALARRYVKTVFRPQVLQLRRLVIMEAARFPRIARAYYQQVPERTVAALADSFRNLGERRLLRVDDPALAAAQFSALVLLIPLDRAMFGGAVAEAELIRLADAGVGVFLSAYGAE